MTPLLSNAQGYALLIGWGASMYLATLFFARRFGTRSRAGFLLAERQVPWWLGGCSIAASWTWAIALMVSVQLSYENGMAGAFWFTVPNVIAVLVYIWLGPLIRRKLPEGYSLAEWFHHRYQSTWVTGTYLLVCGFYQVMAVTVQIWAGSHLFSAAAGIPVSVLMPLILLLVLGYTLISGLEASVVTDFVQLILLLVGVWVVVIPILGITGGQMSFAGLGAAGGVNPFDLEFALTTGIITSIGLISGSIGDQQLWQRAFALRSGDVKKGFLLGAVLFALVPLGCSILGFTAASEHLRLAFPTDLDPSLVGFAIVRQLLPVGLAAFFLVALLSGLASTLDSGLSAWTSLMALAHDRPWLKDRLKPADYTVRTGRGHMLVVAGIGLALAFGVESIPGFSLKYLWWLMNTMGTSVAVPTVLSLTWSRLTARGILLSSSINLLLGLPLIAYASFSANDQLLAAAYVGILCISAICCIATAERAAETASR